MASTPPAAAQLVAAAISTGSAGGGTAGTNAYTLPGVVSYITELDNSNNTFRQENVTLRVENATLDGNNKILQVDNDKLDADNDTLREKNSALQKSNETLKGENKSLAKANKELEKDNEKLKKENKALKSENSLGAKGLEVMENVISGWLPKRKNDSISMSNLNAKDMIIQELTDGGLLVTNPDNRRKEQYVSAFARNVFGEFMDEDFNKMDEIEDTRLNRNKRQRISRGGNP